MTATGTEVETMTFAEAIRAALSHEMEADERVFVLGEDIGIYGGAFGVTTGMLERFGAERSLLRLNRCAAAVFGLGGAAGGQLFEAGVELGDRIGEPRATQRGGGVLAPGE